ncbi:hypothetical protein BDF21DRAFT_495590 [Thamnidium elegans]|nr:hypothetical protein BDF21DRAFT_495590 [Thamnidium elegans]
MNQVVAYMADGLSFIEYMIKTGISNILKDFLMTYYMRWLIAHSVNATIQAMPATKQIYATCLAINTTLAGAILTESSSCLAYGIGIDLSCTDAQDPYYTTNDFVELYCPANDVRTKTFMNKKSLYDTIFNLLYKVVAPGLEKPDSRREAFRSILSGCKDQAFAYYII